MKASFATICRNAVMGDFHLSRDWELRGTNQMKQLNSGILGLPREADNWNNQKIVSSIGPVLTGLMKCSDGKRLL